MQFSVALLHWQRGNFTGALGVFRTSLDHLENCRKELEDVGVDSEKLRKEIERALFEIYDGREYHEINIPRR